MMTRREIPRWFPFALLIAALAVVCVSLLFHLAQPGVVVGKLIEVSEGDLAGENRVVVSDVRGGVVEAVFELHVHAGTELLNIERCR